MDLSCHCGGVTITLPHAPDEITHCNCSLCTKTGFRGIYYREGEVSVSGKVDGYVRSDLDEVYLTNWHCPTCGVATHWTSLTDDDDRTGVNGRLLDPDFAATLPIRQVDGASW